MRLFLDHRVFMTVDCWIQSDTEDVLMVLSQCSWRDNIAVGAYIPMSTTLIMPVAPVLTVIPPAWSSLYANRYSKLAKVMMDCMTNSFDLVTTVLPVRHLVCFQPTPFSCSCRQTTFGLRFAVPSGVMRRPSRY